MDSAPVSASRSAGTEGSRAPALSSLTTTFAKLEIMWNGFA